MPDLLIIQNRSSVCVYFLQATVEDCEKIVKGLKAISAKCEPLHQASTHVIKNIITLVFNFHILFHF